MRNRDTPMSGSHVIAVRVIGSILGGASCGILIEGYRKLDPGARKDWVVNANAGHLYTGMGMLAACFLLVSFGMCVPQDW